MFIVVTKKFDAFREDLKGGEEEAFNTQHTFSNNFNILIRYPKRDEI